MSLDCHLGKQPVKTCHGEAKIVVSGYSAPRFTYVKELQDSSNSNEQSNKAKESRHLSSVFVVYPGTAVPAPISCQRSHA